MGSLTSGWDSKHPGEAPKELVDVPDGERQKGYFEKLEERKLSRRSSEKVPLGLAPPATSFKRICPPEVPSALFHHHSLGRASMPTFERTSRSSYKDHAPSLKRASTGIVNRYRFTDWESELSTVGSMVKGGACMGDAITKPNPSIPLDLMQSPKVTLSPTLSGEHKGVERSSWWKNMDSARNLFEAASSSHVEVEENPRNKKSSFTPQCLTPSSLIPLSASSKAATAI